MNNFTTKLCLLFTLTILITNSSFAKFDFLQLAQDLDSINNKIQFKAKNELRNFDQLEALLKIKLDKGEDLALVIKVIRNIHIKYLLPDLMKNANKWANLGVYATINTLTDKERIPLVTKFYEEKIHAMSSSDKFLKHGYFDFYEYNNQKIDYKVLTQLFMGNDSELRFKIAQYLISDREKYAPQEVSELLNKAIEIGSDELKLEILKSLSRFSKLEIRKYKINTLKCKSDPDEKIKDACKNVRKYLI